MLILKRKVSNSQHTIRNKDHIINFLTMNVSFLNSKTYFLYIYQYCSINLNFQVNDRSSYQLLIKENLVINIRNLLQHLYFSFSY